MARKKSSQPTERFEVEWCTHVEVEGDSMVPDLNKYETRHFYKLDDAIAFAKSCRFDLLPVSIRREVLSREIVGGEDFGPWWEHDGNGVLIDVMGEEIVDYR